MYIKPVNTFLMKERLLLFCHLQQRDDDTVAKSVLTTQIEVGGPIETRHEGIQDTSRVGFR